MGSINKLVLLHQVHKNQWLKPSELEELQNKKLRAIINHAYSNTEFYYKKIRNAGINPENIFTTAELLDPPTRKLINSTFDVELVDLFGCMEVNRTAWEFVNKLIEKVQLAK